MTVATQPHKVTNFVVFPIFILVMHDDDTCVTYFAQLAYCKYARALHDNSVGTHAIFPVGMSFTRKLLVSPNCLTRFVTKELAAL